MPGFYIQPFPLDFPLLSKRREQSSLSTIAFAPLPPHLPASPPFLLFLLLIPRHTLIKTQCAPKAIQRAPNSEIDLPATQPLHELQVVNAASPAGVRDGQAAPFTEGANEVLVDAALQTFVIGGVDEEFGGVWFEGLDRFCGELVSHATVDASGSGSCTDSPVGNRARQGKGRRKVTNAYPP